MVLKKVVQLDFVLFYGDMKLISLPVRIQEIAWMQVKINCIKNVIYMYQSTVSTIVFLIL